MLSTFHAVMSSSCPECPIRPIRFLVCVTADDLDRTEDMLNKLFPLVSPRDLLILLHVIDESVDYVVEGETEEEEKVNRSPPRLTFLGELRHAKLFLLVRPNVQLCIQCCQERVASAPRE